MQPLYVAGLQMPIRSNERSIRWRWRPVVVPLIVTIVLASLTIMYSKAYLQASLTLAGLLTLSDCSPLSQLVSRDVTTANAEAAFNTLQQWYNQSTGLWIPSTGWWNSANCITVIADLAAVDGNVKGKATNIFSNTYTNAQKYNLQMTKVQGVQSDASSPWESFLPRCYYQDHNPPPQAYAQSLRAQATGGFLNE